MKPLHNLVIFILTICTTTLFADGVQPSGSGTENNPYQVENLDNLLWISTNPSSWDCHFLQTNDINASSTQNWNSGLGFSPIGNSATAFEGHYNGANHEIQGLCITRESSNNVGLFGHVYEAVIENISLIYSTISGNSNVGGIAGKSEYYSRIQDCHVTGNVSGENNYIGGVVGYCDRGSILLCSNDADIDGYYHIGGIAGLHKDNDVLLCYNTGSISGFSAYGIVGYSGSNTVYDTDVFFCYNTGDINGSYNAGGIASLGANTRISGCYNSGHISAGNSGGGICPGNQSDSRVTDCFWDIQTSGQTTSRGGVGKTTYEMKNVNTYTNINSTGLVNPWDFEGNYNDDSEFRDYWQMDYSVNSGYPFFAWNSPEFLHGTTPLGNGTKLSPFLISSCENLRWISHNISCWNKCFRQTTDIDASASSSWNNGTGHVPIGSCNLLYSSSQPRHLLDYSGYYDGHEHEISNLYICRPVSEYQGLFGNVTDATIQDVKLNNINYHVGDYSGGLIGSIANTSVSNCEVDGVIITTSDCIGLLGGACTSSSIIDCSSTGSICGEDYVGGLIGSINSTSIIRSFSYCSVDGIGRVGGLVGESNGWSQQPSEIDLCYAHCNTTGESLVGGLVGFQVNSSRTYNSYSMGTVCGDLGVGGLVGAIYSYIVDKCYSNCFVQGTDYVGGLIGYNLENAPITNSFWDTQMSCQNSSAGGTGKTTALMQDIATYTNTSTSGLSQPWDFFGTVNNDTGTDDLWGLYQLNNYGFPYLFWQSYETQTISSIHGSVSGYNGEDIDGATVVITGASVNRVLTTNSQGEFHLSGISDNQINVFISKDGYIDESRTIGLAPGDNYCYITMMEEGASIDYLELSSSLNIYANAIFETSNDVYTLSGNVNINGILAFPGSVQVDMRSYLVYPKVHFTNGATATNIAGSNYQIIPSMPLTYIVDGNQLIPQSFAYVVSTDWDLAGFDVEVGRLVIDQSPTMGEYVEIMAMVEKNGNSFFAEIMDYGRVCNENASPRLYITQMENISGSIYFGRNSGIEYGCDISGVSCNFGVFSVEDFSLWLEPADDTFGGSITLRIPGVGNFRGDGSSIPLDTPVLLSDQDTGQEVRTDLQGFIEMYRTGIFQHLEIEALLEFSSGQLNSLAISVSGMNIPLFNTGAFITEISGGVYDMAVNDLRVEASVDIGLHSSLDVPGIGPVVELNDVGTTIKPWHYFEGSGDFQMFGQTLADARIYYDANRSALGVNGHFALMTEMNDPSSSIIEGNQYGSIESDCFNAGLNAQIKTPDDLPWFLNWAEGIQLASTEASIHNFELTSMVYYMGLSLAQKCEYGRPSFPWFYYYLGSNYDQLVQIWRGTRDGRQTIDFQVPENTQQFLVVAGNDANLFTFTLVSTRWHDIRPNNRQVSASSIHQCNL